MDSALLLIDSLKDQHLLPEYKANYFRGQIHYRLGQELTAELYYKRALTTNELYNDRPSLYYFVSDQLSTILTVKGDQDGAVKTATEKQRANQCQRSCGRIITHEDRLYPTDFP